MNIYWNKVTWYSKLLAIIFFIAILPTWTFYIGMQYEKTVDSYNVNDTPSQVSVPTNTSDTPTTKQITIITPDNDQESHVHIKDLTTGKECDTENLLATQTVLSKDESTLTIFSYSGSSELLTVVDTSNCHTVDKTINLSL